MADTAELDTKQETPSPNGHDDTWLSFNTGDALLQHILSKEPVEELVPVPEWNVKILCKSLDGEARIVVEGQAWNAETKRTNYSKVAHLFVLYGCYHPTTGERIFSEEHKEMLKEPRNGGAVARLFITIIRLSGMLSSDTERAKKN